MSIDKYKILNRISGQELTLEITQISNGLGCAVNGDYSTAADYYVADKIEIVEPSTELLNVLSEFTHNYSCAVVWGHEGMLRNGLDDLLGKLKLPTLTEARELLNDSLTWRTVINYVVTGSTDSPSTVSHSQCISVQRGLIAADLYSPVQLGITEQVLKRVHLNRIANK